jgi:hypothetical protein
MSYGLEIKNIDGRKIIDTEEVANNTFIVAKQFSAYSNMKFPPDAVGGISFNENAGDLILARPANKATGMYTLGSSSGGYVQIGKNFYGSGQQYFAGAQNETKGNQASVYGSNIDGINVGLLKIQKGNISAPSSNEYGLDVMNADNSIRYSATRSTSVDILQQGQLSLGQTVTYTPPSTLTWDKIYAVVNDTQVFYAFSGGGSGFSSFRYKFYPLASTPYITIQNTIELNGTTAAKGSTFGYILIYDPN